MVSGHKTSEKAQKCGNHRCGAVRDLSVAKSNFRLFRYAIREMTEKHIPKL